MVPAAALIVEVQAAARLAIAALIGLAVGVEREWSGQSTGRPPHFAGLRTFTMLGALGGCSGLLLANGYPGVATTVMAGATALAVAAYVMTVRVALADPDGTTEVAALLVVALGALAGLDMLALAAGAGAIVVLLLGEKQALHGAVRHVRTEELQAALRFSVLALVVLPLLPEGPLLGPLELRPRALWMIVLLLCALNFGGFVARRAVGDRRGYKLVGLLGGLVSSTAVTLDFSRHSKLEPEVARSLAFGVIGACTVLIPRVLVVSAVLNPRVSVSLLRFLLPVLFVGGLMVVFGWRANEAESPAPSSPVGSPLRLWMAIRMAIVFQVAMVAIAYVRSRWEIAGLYGTAAVLGLTDVDALTVGMSRPTVPLASGVAARAITVGILANTFFKLTLSGVLGGAGFRRLAITGLTLIGLTIGFSLLLNQ
jgi:uncharacterized membrane protein (DUF4010 family)